MELSNELAVYNVNATSGQLTHLQSIRSSSRLEADVRDPQADQKAAAVRFDPSGQYVLVSNRDGRVNSIQSFALDATSGLVTMVDEVDSGGHHPRDFIFLSPELVLVANQLSNSVTVLDFDAARGTLSQRMENNATISLSQPVALIVVGTSSSSN